MSNERVERAATFAGLLSGETRIKILESIRHNPLNIGQISEIIDLEQSTVSHQIQKLKDSGVVRIHREKRNHLCSKTEKGEFLLKILDMFYDNMEKRF